MHLLYSTLHNSLFFQPSPLNSKVINPLNILKLLLKPNLQILQPPIVEPKHPPMHNRIPILLIRLLHRRRLNHVPRLLDDVELNKAIIPLALVIDGAQFLVMQTVHIADVTQPGVQQTKILRRHGGFDTAAAVVSAHNDVLDVQMADGVVDDGHDVEVGVADEVRDVAMDEHLAGFEAGDGFGGDAGVGAAWWYIVSLWGSDGFSLEV